MKLIDKTHAAKNELALILLDLCTKQGTSPTCHDFGSVVAAADASSGGEGVIPMLVGFTGGQIQLVDPVRKELSKLYNEERLVEQSRFVHITRILPLRVRANFGFGTG